MSVGDTVSVALVDSTFVFISESFAAKHSVYFSEKGAEDEVSSLYVTASLLISLSWIFSLDLGFSGTSFDMNDAAATLSRTPACSNAVA